MNLSQRLDSCGRVTGGPAENRNVHSRVGVGMGREATLNTEESILRRTIGPRDVTARGASLAGVGRVNEHNRHTRQRRLVLDKAAQLVKRPRVQLASLRAPSLYPVADARQIFEGNGASGALRLLYKLLTDGVIDVRHKARLPAGKPPDHAPGRLRSFGLEPLPLAVTALPDRDDVRATVLSTVAVSGDVHQTEVNAQRAVNVNLLWRLHFTGDEQVELAPDKAQIGFSSLPLQQRKSAAAAHEGYVRPAGQCPDGDFPPIQFEGQEPVIVGKSTMLLEAVLLFLADFIGIRDFGDGANNHLCGEVKSVTGRAVDNLVQAELTEDAFTESLLANPVAGGVGLLKRLQEKAVLFGRWAQLQLRRKSHIMKFSTIVPIMQSYHLARFPLPAEAGSLQRRN